MSSYIEKHLSFGVDEFEGLWRLQFLHPFFYGNEKQYVTVYVVPSNSDYTEDEYKGYEVVDMGPNLAKVIDQLLPRINSYPYRWELEGKKLDTFGYDLVSGMVKGSDKVNDIDFTDIAFQEISRYYTFTEPVALPDVVTEVESVEGKGAMVKLQLTMEKAQWVNEVALDFFTEYPIEVKALMYKEDTMKYAPLYEIEIDNATSSTSLSFGFPSVFAKQFIFILCQPTYTIASANKSKADVKKEALWEMFSGTVAANISSIVEEQWKSDVLSATKQAIEKKGKTEAETISTYNKDWRPEYYSNRAEYQKKMIEYKENLKAYEEAQSKYKKEMEAYVRYQQELADWYSKWG